jgi:two-component system phosphate regulon sensor histidine kinase PhoR
MSLPGDLLAALGEHVDEGIVLVAPAHSVLWANASARALLGPGLGDYRLRMLADAALDGRAAVDEIGDALGERIVVARAYPLQHDGVTYAAVVLRDETRLRHLETVRRDFVANVSHELRTPVTAIQLLVDTLQNGALGEPAAAAEFVERIGSEVAHLRQMVDELLELSLMEAGERPLRVAPVEAATLVAVADRLRPLAEERGVAVHYDVAPQTPPIRGDIGRLELVVRNLVHNAIKFTPRGGRVTVRARGAGAASVAVIVEDTGVGIPADLLPRVFERFYKADRARLRDGTGAGLGLAIARHTVEAHGGRIDVASEVGHGTTFTVTLPAAR